MQDGKYIWDMEPWYIAEFDDETSNNTVVVPKEIKAWYGSHTSGTYGVLGMPSNKGTTQTLIVGKDTNLTLVNMKVLSSVKILVKDGGVLNLRDSSIYGLVVVQDGGKLQVNYDPREDIFTTGTSINGQIQLFDGAILDTSKIYSNTNFLTDKGIANRNVDPVVVANGNVTVNGKVFIMGDAAPTGIDSNTGRIYTGQHAMGLNIGARLHINKDSILGLYGGGKLFNNSYGGNALTMAEGTSLTGEGSLIAIPGNSALGNGATAIKGEGTLAAKQMYIQGGNTYDKNAAGGKALGENVKIDLSVNPIGKVVDGRSGTGETTKDQPNYWDYFNDPPVYSYIEGSDYKQPITAEQIGNHVLNNEGKTDEPGNANNDQPGNDNQSQGNGGQAGNNSDNGSTGGSSNSGNTNSGNSNSGNSNSNAGSSNTNNAGNSNSNNAGSSNTANNSSNRNTRTESPRERYQSYDPADRAETTVIEDNKTPLSNLDEKEKKEKEKAALQELEKKLENKEITKASFLKQLSDSTLAEKAKEIKTVFKDVDENAWYVKELSALKMASLINGYEDGTLRAERYITGKEFVTLLVRAAGLELVEAKGDWFAPYLKAAQDNGLLEGVSFDLAKMITREEIAKLAHNYAKRGVKEEVKDKKAVSFRDETSIDKQYMEAITCLYNKGILKGRTDGNFSPKDMTKRSEIIAIIYRLLTLAQN